MLRVMWRYLLSDREFLLIQAASHFWFTLSLSSSLCTFSLPLSHLIHPQNCRRPISACWYVTTPGSIEYHPVDPDPTPQPTPAPSFNFTCRLMTDAFLWEPMTFPTAGQYVFVAVFYNNASKANSTIPFGVVQGEWFLMCTIAFKTHCSCTHYQLGCMRSTVMYMLELFCLPVNPFHLQATSRSLL